MSKAPGMPANAQISKVTRFIGTGTPKKFAKTRTMMPSIELTAKYFPNLAPSLTRIYSTIKTRIATTSNPIAVVTSIRPT